MGCELAQGYALCRPLSPQHCARAVREHQAPGTPTRPLAAASHVALAPGAAASHVALAPGAAATLGLRARTSTPPHS
jgi:hypothetical protein